MKTNKKMRFTLTRKRNITTVTIPSQLCKVQNFGIGGLAMEFELNPVHIPNDARTIIHI